MGNTRKVSTSQIEADADKDLLRVSKHLLDSAELKAIGRFDGEIRRFLYNICLPFEIGIHLLPVAALETVEERLRKFAEDRQALVTAFLSVYPGLSQDAAKRLRGLYNPADYPAVDEVTREFGLSWQYVSFGVPDQLKGISQEVWEQERDKAAQRMAEASSEIQQVLRQSMADLVAHMAERLKDGADGKPLKFKQSTVSNLVEFLSNFSFRNVTDDRQLQELAYFFAGNRSACGPGRFALSPIVRVTCSGNNILLETILRLRALPCVMPQRRRKKGVFTE